MIFFDHLNSGRKHNVEMVNNELITVLDRDNKVSKYSIFGKDLVLFIFKFEILLSNTNLYMYFILINKCTRLGGKSSFHARKQVINVAFLDPAVSPLVFECL